MGDSIVKIQPDSGAQTVDSLVRERISDSAR